MQSTPGKRLQEWREFKGLSLAEVFRLTGVKVTTLSTAEQPGGSNPSYDTLSKLLAAFPDLNPDWLLLGTGPMLRDGKTLTPAPRAEAPAASQVPAGYGATVEAAINKARLADATALIVEQREEIARLNRELGKPLGGFDAAAPTDTAPRRPIAGFQLSSTYRQRHRGAANLS